MPAALSQSVEPDEEWKVRLRRQIGENLQIMIDDTITAFETTLSQIPEDEITKRQQVNAEYTEAIYNVKRIAVEEYELEVERERQERRWTVEMVVPNGWSSALQREQQAIMQAIRRKADGHGQTGVEHEGDLRQLTMAKSEEGTLVRRDQLQENPKSQTLTVAQRRPSFNEQQEQFRKREQEIRRRAEERKKQSQINWEESIGSAASTWTPPERPNHDSAPSSPATGASGTVRDNLTKKQLASLFSYHEQQWTRISTFPWLQWIDFPWPVLSYTIPPTQQDLTLASVRDYILSPLYPDPSESGSKKERVKELLRKWHPDRFEIKFLRKVMDEGERGIVREGAGMVVRILNDLLSEMNDM